MLVSMSLGVFSTAMDIDRQVRRYGWFLLGVAYSLLSNYRPQTFLSSIIFVAWPKGRHSELPPKDNPQGGTFKSCASQEEWPVLVL